MNEENQGYGGEKTGLKVDYERTLYQTRLILKKDLLYTEDYQMRMLRANQPQKLLNVNGQGQNETSRYVYDISGKTAMKHFYEERKIQYKDMERFVRQFTEVLREIQNLLLDPDGLLLGPDFIYIEEDQFYFCFCPVKNGTIWEEFHRLTEYFVRRVDYEEKEGIYLAYELHKASMEENYNIEHAIEEIMEKKEKELETLFKPIEKEKPYKLDEEVWMEDWEEEKNGKDEYVREKQTVWKKIGDKVRGKKKKPWGEWDGIDM